MKTKTYNGKFRRIFIMFPIHFGVYVSGAYDDEEAAAHAYDLAALKYWGSDIILNFPVPYLLDRSHSKIFHCLLFPITV